MEFKELIRNNLEGEDLINALDLVDYLVDKGINPKKEWEFGYRFIKNGKSPCMIFMIGKDHGGGWVICDLPVVTEPEWNLINDDLKEFIISNIKTCSVHMGNPCGCGSEPGTSKTIFDKLHNNVCTSEIQIVSPDLEELKKFKEIIEWWLTDVCI